MLLLFLKATCNNRDSQANNGTAGNIDLPGFLVYNININRKRLEVHLYDNGDKQRFFNKQGLA